MAIYGYSRAKAQIGQVEDSAFEINDSFVAEEVIDFGIALMRGTDPEKQVKKFNGGLTTKILGISAYSATRIEGSYAIGSDVRVLSKGRIHLTIPGSETVVPGATAYVNITDDVITSVFTVNEVIPIGKFLDGGVTSLGNPVILLLELDPGVEEG